SYDGDWRRRQQRTVFHDGAFHHAASEASPREWGAGRDHDVQRAPSFHDGAFHHAASEASPREWGPVSALPKRGEGREPLVKSNLELGAELDHAVRRNA